MRPVKHKARHEKQNIVSKIKKLQHKIDDVNDENDRYVDAYIRKNLLGSFRSQRRRWSHIKATRADELRATWLLL